MFVSPETCICSTLDCLRKKKTKEEKKGKKKPYSFTAFSIATSQTQQKWWCLENTETGRNKAEQRLGLCSQKPLGDRAATLPWQLQRAESLTGLISWNSSLAILTKFYFILRSGEKNFFFKINAYWKAKSPFKIMSNPIRTGCIFQKYSKYVHIYQSRTVTIETKRSPFEWKTNHCSKFPYKCLCYTNHNTGWESNPSGCVFEHFLK